MHFGHQVLCLKAIYAVKTACVIVLLALVEALQTVKLLAAGAQDVFKSPLFTSC